MAERETRTEPKAEPRFEQTVDADGNVLIECIMGPYRGQYLKVPEAVGTAAIADKWAREPSMPPIDHETPPIALAPEELEAALAASYAAAEHLRGTEGAPVYPVPPDPPITRGARARRDDDDEEDGRKRK